MEELNITHLEFDEKLCEILESEEKRSFRELLDDEYVKYGITESMNPHIK